MRASTRPEHRLLLACCRLTLLPEHLAEIRRVLAGPLDWQVILDLSTWHRVSALLAKHLGRQELAGQVPESALRRLQRVYNANAALYLLFKSELLRLLDSLQRHGIRAILLKGAVLAEEVYGDAALRPMGDVDLLVEEEDLEPAYSLVRELGYAPRVGPELESDEKITHRHYPRLVGRDRPVCFEVHRHVVRRDVPFYFDISAFWQRARVLPLGSATTLTLAPADLLTHLAIGFFLDSRSRYPSRKALARLVDIAETVRYFEDELDWQVVLESIVGTGLQGPVSWSLLTAVELLDLEPPAAALQSLCGGLLSPSQIDLFIERRVLRESPWFFHELLDPRDRSRWNGVKAALRRILPGRSQLEGTYRIPRRRSVPLGRLYAWHLRELWASASHYLVHPAAWQQDLRVDRWLYHTYAGT